MPAVPRPGRPAAQLGSAMWSGAAGVVDAHGILWCHQAAELQDGQPQKHIAGFSMPDASGQCQRWRQFGQQGQRQAEQGRGVPLAQRQQASTGRHRISAYISQWVRSESSAHPAGQGRRDAGQA